MDAVNNESSQHDHIVQTLVEHVCVSDAAATLSADSEQPLWEMDNIDDLIEFPSFVNQEDDNKTIYEIKHDCENSPHESTTAQKGVHQACNNNKNCARINKNNKTPNGDSVDNSDTEDIDVEIHHLTRAGLPFEEPDTLSLVSDSADNGLQEACEDLNSDNNNDDDSPPASTTTSQLSGQCTNKTVYSQTAFTVETGIEYLYDIFVKHYWSYTTPLTQNKWICIYCTTQNDTTNTSCTVCNAIQAEEASFKSWYVYEVLGLNASNCDTNAHEHISSVADVLYQLLTTFKATLNKLDTETDSNNDAPASTTAQNSISNTINSITQNDDHNDNEQREEQKAKEIEKKRGKTEFLAQEVSAWEAWQQEDTNSIIEVRPDGNCLLRAVSQSVFSTTAYHDKLRILCAYEMVYHKPYFANAMLIDNDEAYLKAVVQVCRLQRYLNDVCITCVSLATGMIVEVWQYVVNEQSGHSKIVRQTTTADSGFFNHISGEPIRLAYQHGAHYDLMHTSNNSCNESIKSHSMFNNESNLRLINFWYDKICKSCLENIRCSLQYDIDVLKSIFNVVSSRNAFAFDIDGKDKLTKHFRTKNHNMNNMEHSLSINHQFSLSKTNKLLLF